MSLARALPTVSAFVVLFVLARFLLAPEELAHYRKLWPFFSLWAPVVISAIVNAAYFKGSDPVYARAAMSQTVTLFFVGGFFVGGSALLLSGVLAQFFNVPHLGLAYAWFGVYATAAIWGSSAEPIFVLSGNRTKLPAFAATFTLLDMAAILIPFWLGSELVDVVKWMVLAQISRQLVIIPQFLKWRALLLAPISSSLFERRVLYYAGGMALLSLSGVGAAEIDRFIIGRFLDDTAFILYDVGARKLPFVTILTASVTSAIVAGFASKVSQGEFSGALSKIRRSTTLFIRLLLPSIIFLAVAAEPFIAFIFGPEYVGSGPIFALFLVALASNLFFPQSLVLATGKVRVNVIGAMCELVLNVSLSLALVHQYGIVGVAFSTAVAHWFYTAAMALYCKVKLRVELSRFIPEPLGWEFYALTALSLVLGFIGKTQEPHFVLAFYAPVGILTMIFSKRWL